MPNGDQSKVQWECILHVWNHSCAVCLQPLDAPFTIAGLEFTKPCEIKATKAHVVSQLDGGKWHVSNIVPKHQYCNGIDQSVSDYRWVIRRYWSDFTTVEQFESTLEKASKLYKRILDALHRNGQIDLDVITVLKSVAQYIRENPDKNATKRLNGKDKILRLAS